MKHRFLGIFSKIFFYTALILLMVITIMFLFFSDQIKSVVTMTQQQQIYEVFQPMLKQLNGKSEQEIIEFARQFHEKNTYFDFKIEDAGEHILYQTENFKELPLPKHNSELSKADNLLIGENPPLDGKNFRFSMLNDKDTKAMFITMTESGVRLYMSTPLTGDFIYRAFLEKTILAFILMFITSLGAAAVFARQIARPVEKIAQETKRMSRLEPVEVPRPRQDEIGQLAQDVYAMYENLKRTIRQLETEIKREKEMEENQRYFFSAASHELKTPITATSAILEGMLEEVIEPAEYPKYLRECMGLMKEQSRLVSEILEIVKLNNDAARQDKERVALKACVNNALSACLPLIEAKEQHIEVDMDERLFCSVDVKLFGKVLSNILLNATQNSPAHAKIRVCGWTENNRVRLHILNEGAKIPEEELPKLFEPFFRRDEARTYEDGRTGLGLTIVKKALELMEIPFSLTNVEEGVLFQMELLK